MVSGSCLDFGGDLHQAAPVGIEVANFNREFSVIVSQPEFRDIVARCAQMQALFAKAVERLIW